MKLTFSLVFVLLISCVFAQTTTHYIYVQTDNNQPFYIKLNDKLYSSSASGYTIISKLTKAEYDLTIGFPKNEFPEQKVTIAVNGDAGYLLKNFGAKGWGLYNMQTMQVAMATSNAANSNTQASVKNENNNDGFAGQLAGVVDNPRIKETPKPKEETPKTKENSTAMVETPKPTEQIKNSIKKISSTIGSNGTSLIYLDVNGSTTDTVDLLLPPLIVSNTSSENVEKTVVVEEKPEEKKSEVETKVVSNNASNSDKKFLDIELPNPNGAAPETQKAEPTKIETNTRVVSNVGFNSDCKAEANENDFLKIRKKMASASSDEKMIGEAKKFFKSKCYSTEQIKNLSVLFLNDSGKYQFLDAAYPFVYDSGNFGSLKSILSDEYYVNRFEAMIRK